MKIQVSASTKSIGDTKSGIDASLRKWEILSWQLAKIRFYKFKLIVVNVYFIASNVFSMVLVNEHTLS